MALWSQTDEVGQSFTAHPEREHKTIIIEEQAKATHPELTYQQQLSNAYLIKFMSQLPSDEHNKVICTRIESANAQKHTLYTS